MPCHCRIVLLLIKERKLMLYLPAPLRSFGEARPAGSKARLCSCSWDTFYCERSEAKLISDISMRICSEASMAEIPLLVAVFLSARFLEVSSLFLFHNIIPPSHFCKLSRLLDAMSVLVRYSQKREFHHPK